MWVCAHAAPATPRAPFVAELVKACGYEGPLSARSLLRAHKADGQETTGASTPRLFVARKKGQGHGGSQSKKPWEVKKTGYARSAAAPSPLQRRGCRGMPDKHSWTVLNITEYQAHCAEVRRAKTKLGRTKTAEAYRSAHRLDRLDHAVRKLNTSSEAATLRRALRSSCGQSSKLPPSSSSRKRLRMSLSSCSSR